MTSNKDLKRFWAKVQKTENCWLWKAGQNGRGYGVFWFVDRLWLAHRWIWTQVNGPIPDELDIDHVKKRGCSNRNCVNPDHLEPVTRQVNLLRGLGPKVTRDRRDARSHCPEGHPLEGDNVYLWKDGARRCRTCCRKASREWKQRKRAV